MYQELARRGELTAHVAAYPVVQPELGTPQIEVAEALRARFKVTRNLTIPGLKVFADGVTEFPSQTAALTKPYTNSGRSAPLLFTRAKMNALAAEAAKARAQRAYSCHRRSRGQGVTGCLRGGPHGRAPKQRFVDPQDIPRSAQLRVVALLQLLWASPEASGSVKPYIDPEIYRWMYPARSILDAGGEIAGGSDWPVSSTRFSIRQQIYGDYDGKSGLGLTFQVLRDHICRLEQSNARQH